MREKQKWNRADYQKLRADLAALADPQYRDFHKKLITDNSQVLGVRMERLRRLARGIAESDFSALLPLLDENSYEEMMLYGLILGYQKTEVEHLQEQLAVFLPKINNWAVCDGTVSALKAIGKAKERFYGFLLPYLDSDREYEVRFAVVTLMRYYTDAVWVDRILVCYRRVDHPGYYVRMAVAWAVAEAYIKEKEKAEILLREKCLPQETQNKAIQKIRESFRVPAAEKEAVTKWRLSTDKSSKSGAN